MTNQKTKQLDYQNIFNRSVKNILSILNIYDKVDKDLINLCTYFFNCKNNDIDFKKSEIIFLKDKLNIGHYKITSLLKTIQDIEKELSNYQNLIEDEPQPLINDDLPY